MSISRLAVGLAVYALRKEAGMTLDALSKPTEMNVSSLSRTESGQRDLSFIEAVRIVEAFNTDIASFTALAEEIQRQRPVPQLRAFKQRRDRTVQLATQIIMAQAKRKKHAKK